MEELLSAISTISQHFRIFSRPCPRSPYTLSPPAFLTLVQVISFFTLVQVIRLPGPGYQVQFIRPSLSGYPLRPRSESGQCGGGRQPPFCLQPLIFYLRQNRPCLCTIPIGKAQPCESKRRRIKTHQLGVRTALVSRYFPRQLDVGSLVVTSRLPSPTLLALPAIREPW